MGLEPESSETGLTLGEPSTWAMEKDLIHYSRPEPGSAEVWCFRDQSSTRVSLEPEDLGASLELG